MSNAEASDTKDVSDLSPPALNFLKTDQTGEAKLQEQIKFNEVRSGDSPLAQVFPLELHEGDQVELVAWTEDLAALYLYAPSARSNLWTSEQNRLVSAPVKPGVDQLTLRFSAENEGVYAVVLQPLEGAAQFLITSRCIDGDCLRIIEEEAARSVREDQAESGRPMNQGTELP